MLISILLHARQIQGCSCGQTAKADKRFNCGTKFSIMIRRESDHHLIPGLSMVFSKA